MIGSWGERACSRSFGPHQSAMGGWCFTMPCACSRDGRPSWPCRYFGSRCLSSQHLHNISVPQLGPVLPGHGHGIHGRTGQSHGLHSCIAFDRILLHPLLRFVGCIGSAIHLQNSCGGNLHGPIACASVERRSGRQAAPEIGRGASQSVAFREYVGPLALVQAIGRART